MQIVYLKANGLVMYAGADLSAGEITNLGDGWCDRRVTPTLAAVADAGILPTDWLPDSYTWTGGVYTVVPGKEYLLEVGSPAVGGFPPAAPSGLEVAVTNEISGSFNTYAVLVATISWDNMGISIDHYDINYRKAAVPGWTAAPSTPEDFSIIHGLSVDLYHFRVRAVTTSAVPGPWTEIGPIVVESIGATGIPKITGLQIYGQGSDHVFLGTNPRFVWASSTVIVGEHIDWHVGYKIRILNIDNTLRREIYTIDGEYVYSFEDNIADGSGTPTRAFQILVWDQFMSGNLSDEPATIVVSNPQCAAVTIDDNIVFAGGFALSLTLPNEIDLVGVRLWGSGLPTTDFAKQNNVGLQCVASTYTVYVAAFDSFGADNLNPTSIEVIVPSDVTTTDLENWATDITKLFKVPVLQSDIWGTNDPVAGSISWQSVDLYFNGMMHSINDGNTANAYVYWDSTTPTVFKTTTNEAAFSAMATSETLWQIAYNVDGANNLAWSAAANMVIGSAFIREGSIKNAHISGIIESTGFTYLPGISATGWQMDKDGDLIFQSFKMLDSSGNIIFQGDDDITGPPGPPGASTFTYYITLDSNRDALTPVVNELCYSAESEKLWRYNGTGWDLIAISPQAALEADVTIMSGGIVLSNNSRITNVGTNGISTLDSEGLTFTDTDGGVYNYIGRTASGEASGNDYVSLVPNFKSIPKVVIIPKKAVSFKAGWEASDQFFRMYVTEASVAGFRINAELVATTGSVANTLINSVLANGQSAIATTQPTTSSMDVTIQYKGASYLGQWAIRKANSTIFDCVIMYSPVQHQYKIEYKINGQPDTSYVLWISSEILTPTNTGTNNFTLEKKDLPAGTYVVKITKINTTVIANSFTNTFQIPASSSSPSSYYGSTNYNVVYEVGFDGSTRIYWYWYNIYSIASGTYLVNAVDVSGYLYERGTLYNQEYNSESESTHYYYYIRRTLISSILAPTEQTIMAKVIPHEFKVLSLNSVAMVILDDNSDVDYIAYDGG